MPANLGTTTRPCIKLNGTVYPLKEGTQIRKTDITPFAAKISSGDPKYGDFTYSSRIILRDFRGGMGLLNARADKPGRYWHSTLDMRFPYQTTLNLRAVSTTYGNSLPFKTFGEVSGYVVGFSQDTTPPKLYYLDNNTWTVTANPFSTNEHNLLGFTTYTPPGGSETLFVYGRKVSGTAQYAYSTDGITWTAKTAPAVTIRAMVEYDRQLVAFSEDGIYYSQNPSAAVPTWATLLTGMPKRPIDAAIYVDEQNNEAIYFTTDDALWRVNFYAGTLTLVRKFHAGIIGFQNSLSVAQGTLRVHNGALMVATTRGLLRWTLATQTWISPNLDDGLEVGYHGIVTSMFSDGENLWAGIAAGDHGTVDYQYTHLMVYDEQGWHRVYVGNYSSPPSARCAVWVTTTGASPGFTRVFAATEYPAYAPAYIEFPYAAANPLQVSNTTYQYNGELITSWDDGGFAEIPKGAFELAVNYNLKNANNSIDVAYAIDDAASWTSLGTITGAGDLAVITKTLSFGSGYGIAFQKIRFRFTLTRDLNTTTTTPVLNYAILKFIPQPDTKFSWNCTLDFSKAALADVGLDPYTARSLIDAARASKPLVDFQEWPPTSTTYKVKVANRPELEREVNNVLEGEVALAVAEVV